MGILCCVRAIEMVYHGEVRGGVVVLAAGASIPEGTQVTVAPLVSDDIVPPATEPDLRRLGELAVETGITDLATNIDHYLYGHPKVDHGP